MERQHRKAIAAKDSEIELLHKEFALDLAQQQSTAEAHRQSIPTSSAATTITMPKKTATASTRSASTKLAPKSSIEEEIHADTSMDIIGGGHVDDDVQSTSFEQEEVAAVEDEDEVEFPAATAKSKMNKKKALVTAAAKRMDAVVEEENFTDVERESGADDDEYHDGVQKKKQVDSSEKVSVVAKQSTKRGKSSKNPSAASAALDEVTGLVVDTIVAAFPQQQQQVESTFLNAIKEGKAKEEEEQSDKAAPTLVKPTIILSGKETDPTKSKSLLDSIRIPLTPKDVKKRRKKEAAGCQLWVKMLILIFPFPPTGTDQGKRCRWRGSRWSRRRKEEEVYNETRGLGILNWKPLTYLWPLL